MKLPPSTFWNWFRGFAERLPPGDVPDSLQNELLSQLQCFDPRLYFLLSTNCVPRELIITVDGNVTAFGSADELVAAAPTISNWKFISLKPPMGFEFQHTDGPISLDVSKLWFMPTKAAENPSELGIVLTFPDADFVLANQSVDTAYTILEVVIGERACSQDIAHVAVDDLPEDPAADGYLEISRLSEYIAFHKRRYSVG